MASVTVLENLKVEWKVRRAMACLAHPNEQVREKAVVVLRTYPVPSQPRLRRVAFRRRAQSAVTAALLLYEMGDAQGLYALLEQFADGYMYGWYGQALRRSLQQIGPAKILEALEKSLDKLETPLVPPGCWSLSLSVYTLHALKALQADIPLELWRRSIQAYVPNFEELRTVRGVASVVAPSDSRLALAPPLEDWRVGSTVAAVRRVAVDALMTLNRENAFPLLSEALKHPDPQVQLTAMYGLRRLRDPRSYVLLQPFAANRSHPLSRDAKRAIEALGTAEPEALTLVRASMAESALPEQLLRPAGQTEENAPETLLRPSRSDEEPQSHGTH